MTFVHKVSPSSSDMNLLLLLLALIPICLSEELDVSLIETKAGKVAIFVLVAVDANYLLMLAYLVLCYAHLHGLISLMALDERRLV